MIDSAPRILLVEDDDGDAVLIQECLAEVGSAPSTVIWRRSCADGLEALGQRPDCVLLDLGLPDAHGLGALNAIVEAAPDTPVIVLTGRNERTGVDALAAGAEDYLIKDDITPDLLDRSIRYAVERKRAQRTNQQLREARLSANEKSRLERGLLPTPLLYTDLVECSTYYQPGIDHAVLGGDFFDVVEMPRGRVRALIGDVMGHGPDEAALGVHLRVAWRTLVLAGIADQQILPILSRLLAAESGGHGGFVTACDVTIEEDFTARVRVAGHPAPLLCARGKTTYLPVETGPPLGVEGLSRTKRWADSGGWPETEVVVGPGSSLILYTDGLLDGYAATDPQATLGIDELIDATDLCAAAGEPVASWIPTLVGTAPGVSVDDTAVVVLTTRAGPRQ
jgi:CheY-like chemotaxis protein